MTYKFNVSEQPKMHRLYVGNLNPDLDESTLRVLFEGKDIDIGSILVKGKYAFVDCSNQENIDKAIERLNGKVLLA